MIVPKPTRPFLLALLLGLVADHAAAAPIAFDRSPNPNPVRFQRDILPLLQANCLPCHNQTRAKASLNLESPALMLQGGDSGPALVPGNPAQSLLLRSAAHEVEDLAMPPPDNKANARNLSPAELSLLSSWIAQGATNDLSTSIVPTWKPIAPEWQSSFALALSHDGRLAAVGRANRIEWVDVRSGATLGVLADPQLDGAAQPDVVGALAFSPDDSLLAAAGFREVRLWKRQPVVLQPAWNQSPASPWISARLSPNQTLVALQTRDGPRELRSLDSGSLIHQWSPSGPDEPTDISLAWARTDFTPSPALTHTNAFPYDPRPTRAVARIQAELDLARLELAHAARWIPEATNAVKSTGETLAKASEKQTADARLLMDLEKELGVESGKQSGATRERDNLTAELAGLTNALHAAETLLHQARIQLQVVTTNHTAALTHATLADRFLQDLQRLASSPDAIASLNDALKTAASAAESARSQATQSQATLLLAVQDLESKAFATGQRQAVADRARSDLPPRIKQSEELLAAAQKAISALKPKIEKARVTLDGSTQDVALATKSNARAIQSLADAQAAHTLATQRIATSESQLKITQARADLIANHPPVTATLSADSSSLLLLGPDGIGTVWEIGSGHARVTFDLPQSNIVATLALGPDHYLLVGPTNTLLADVACRWSLHRVLGGTNQPVGSSRFIDRINALAFSPDGQLLATGGGEPSRSGELLIWKVADGSLDRDLGPIHSDCVTALAFSPRGHSLASGGADRFARITRLDAEAPRVDLEGHTHHVLGVAWSPDATVLATAGAEGVVKLWNPTSGERRRNIDGFEKEVTGLQPLAVTGQFVAMGGNGRGRILRADGEKIRDLTSVPHYLQVLAITPDGSLALAADDHGRITRWTLSNGEIQRP
jgi:WD40 repeat protein